MSKIEFVELPASPYTRKAKWVLDHHGLEYKVTKYTPGLGEGWLRKKTGKKGGVMTTPVLFTPDGVLMDSFEIAQWADKHGQKDTLFPAEQLETLSRWNRAADDVLEYGRAKVMARLKTDKALRRQMMPPFLNSLGPITDWLGSMMLGPLIKKYDAINQASSAAKADKAFGDLRQAIKSNHGFVLGSFSYADIAMAIACDTIKPLGEPYVQAPEAMRKPDTEWMERFEDLLQYRDRIFRENYPKSMLIA